MEHEDDDADGRVERRERAVERQVLLVLGHDADDPADEDERHDEEVGALGDLGAEDLGLGLWDALELVPVARSLDEDEGEDAEGDVRHELAQGHARPRTAA